MTCLGERNHEVWRVVCVFVVLDFIIAPLGVLTGGLWGSSDTDNAVIRHASETH